MRSQRRNQRRARAQSSVIGIVLILGLTLAAAAGIVTFGTVVLDDGQQQSQVGQAEQALTQFDSRAAQVALGDSDSQRVDIGQANGNYHVDPSAGNVTITHVNRTATSDNETIYEGTFGAFIYTRGDTEIAYQGGGVWRRSDGTSRMVSPPEFHYRRATLTFPVITILGQDSAGGNINARVIRRNEPREIFPNSSDTYPSSTEKYKNPVENGTMKVTIESEYCQGWKQYLETRTEGDVSECDNGNVTAEIVSIGTQGEFEIANEPLLNIRGIETLLDFRLEFRVFDNPDDDDGQESDFSNFKWSMNAREGDQQFEMYLHNNGNGDLDCESNPSDSINVTADIYYSDDGGDTYETWVNNDTKDDLQVVCDGDGDPVFEIDLLGNANMTYMKSKRFKSGGGGDSLPVFRGEGDTFSNTATVNGTTYTTDDQEDIGVVMRHYMEVMGDMDLDIREGNQAGISPESYGYIEYDGSAQVITFLHITENEIEIELEG